MSQRTAVVLFNLGGPDSPSAVAPFLYNLFSDPDIFRLPFGALTQRWFARLLARRRAPAARAAYATLGGRSPLLENTEKQARTLGLALRDRGAYDVYICMRYWHPMTPQVVGELQKKDYGDIILLPLYPQYSITTTGSSYREFKGECARQGYHPQMRLIEPWYDNHHFQEGILQTIRAAAAGLPDPEPAHIELLFSAHGLPEKIVAGGDPYARQIHASYESLRHKLGWPHTSLCYQSRVGPVKWLRPYTDDVIREKGTAGAKQMLVYPIAFVSDHVETLYELGMVYAKLAEESGIEHYHVVPALNDHPLLIRALKQLVLEASQDHPPRAAVQKP